MTDRITPRTAIQEFLNVASISKSTINPSSRTRRRRTLDAIRTDGYVGGDKKRKSQSFSEVTPRTLIQGVLATTEAVPDTARKRARRSTGPPSSSSSSATYSPKVMTPGMSTRSRVMTPGTATRSRRRPATRLDVLATPGGSNPTPRTLIQGLINAAPVETPWHVSTATRRTSPRNKPEFPVVTSENRQGQAQGLSLSPYIRDSSSVQRPGRKLRPGLRRAGAINREKFAAGIAEKLSQEKSADDDTPHAASMDEQTSKEGTDDILDSIHEESGQEVDDDARDDDEHNVDDGEEEPQVTDDGEDAEEDQEEKDSHDGHTILDSMHAEEPSEKDTGQEQDDQREDEGELPEQDEGEEPQVSDDGEEVKENDSYGKGTIQDGMHAEESGEQDAGREEQDSDDQREDEGGVPEEDDREMDEDAASMENSVDEELDAAEQSTLDAAGLMEADLSAGGDSHSMPPTEGAVVDDDYEDEDDAVAATQPARSSMASGSRYRGIDTMLLQETNAATMMQTTLDGYSPLVTPRIAAGRSHKTPALKKTPAPHRDQLRSHRTSLAPKAVQPNKKTVPPKGRQKPKEAELPYTLPLSLTKSIFTHFSKGRVSKDAMKAVMQGSNTFFKRASDDLATYASHAHRHTIEPADVELLMRRQRLVNDKESLHSLIEKYLPMEYRQELIPVARSGNKITPKI